MQSIKKKKSLELMGPRAQVHYQDGVYLPFVQGLAAEFMRTSLFSGVLAHSLHVLIGTRAAVSANVFVP